MISYVKFAGNLSILKQQDMPRIWPYFHIYKLIVNDYTEDSTRASTTSEQQHIAEICFTFFRHEEPIFGPRPLYPLTQA